MVTNTRHMPTIQDVWTDVDEYLAGQLLPSDPILDDVVRTSIEARLPQIQVSPVLGRFLNLQARIQGAKRILEIGTLAGYSTIWLARALPPDGRLVPHAATSGSEWCTSALRRQALAGRAFRLCQRR
jgi:predicted O-methyltransferase YrrM